jgi:VWFA-related protein
MRACLVAILFAATLWAQDATPVFHATSELVLLDVQVIHNKTGTTAAGLEAQDFDLSEDGVAQKISFFGRDQLPLSIVLLFDLTQSVSGVLHRLADGARSALNHLKPEDEVAVMVYAAGARVIDGFTRDRDRTVAAIGRAAKMKSDDAAFFNEAVYQAAWQLGDAANPSSRRVILWLTDNLPNWPTDDRLHDSDKGLRGEMPHSESQAVRQLHQSGVVVMPLLLKDFFYRMYDRVFDHEQKDFMREHPGEKYSPGDAYQYAEVSGGFAIAMRGKGPGKEVEERLAEAIDDLRGRYTIGYRPSEEKPAGTFCRVKVALGAGAPLRAQEWKVLTRAGYYRR